jgi:hypothetical protein
MLADTPHRIGRIFGTIKTCSKTGLNRCNNSSTLYRRLWICFKKTYLEWLMNGQKLRPLSQRSRDVIHDLRSNASSGFPSSCDSTNGTPYSQGYSQYLYPHTNPQNDPQIDQEIEFGDTYNTETNLISDNNQDEGPWWFPQHATDTLGAWLYMGQAICWNNFNVFAKVFALLAITARTSHFTSALF